MLLISKLQPKNIKFNQVDFFDQKPLEVPTTLKMKSWKLNL